MAHSVPTMKVLRDKCPLITRFGSGTPALLALRLLKIMGRFAPEVNLLLRFTSIQNTESRGLRIQRVLYPQFVA